MQCFSWENNDRDVLLILHLIFIRETNRLAFETEKCTKVHFRTFHIYIISILICSIATNMGWAKFRDILLNIVFTAHTIITSRKYQRMVFIVFIVHNTILIYFEYNRYVSDQRSILEFEGERILFTNIVLWKFILLSLPSHDHCRKTINGSLAVPY